MSQLDSINRENVIEWVSAASSREYPATREGAPVEKRPTVVAVVGLSEKPDRPSHRVAAAMQEMGYRIVPVNPGSQTILGETCYPDLARVPAPVDVVQVFRRPEHAAVVAQSAADEKERLGVRVLWLQEGVVSDEAATIAKAAGLDLVMDRCLYKEAVRFRS